SHAGDPARPGRRSPEAAGTGPSRCIVDAPVAEHAQPEQRTNLAIGSECAQPTRWICRSLGDSDGPPVRRRAPGLRPDRPSTRRGAVATGKLPSSMILRLPGGPLRARLDLTLAEWALLCRVDGHRPVAALASRSGRGHHDA